MKNLTNTIRHLLRLDKIRKGGIDLIIVKENQNKYKSSLNEMKRLKLKSKEQKSPLYNIEMLYNLHKSVINFFMIILH